LTGAKNYDHSRRCQGKRTGGACPPKIEGQREKDRTVPSYVIAEPRTNRKPYQKNEQTLTIGRPETGGRRVESLQGKKKKNNERPEDKKIRKTDKKNTKKKKKIEDKRVQKGGNRGKARPKRQAGANNQLTRGEARRKVFIPAKKESNGKTSKNVVRERENGRPAFETGPLRDKRGSSKRRKTL